MRIVQITDTHLFGKQDEQFNQLNTLDSFTAVVEQVKHLQQQAPVNLIVLTGDISQDGSFESYQKCADGLKDFSCPIAWIPGNHDALPVMASAFSASSFTSERHIVIGPWQFILLDSHYENRISGLLPASQVEFLNQCLTNHPQMALVFLHHHVLPIGSQWIDAINLHHSDAFLRSIDCFPQVKAVVSGHVHQDSLQLRRATPFITTPSTSIQFKPDSMHFALDDNMPGFRVFNLNPDGTFETSIERLSYQRCFIPDMTSKGY